MRRYPALAAAALAFGMMTSQPTAAQGSAPYPSKPVKIIVSFPPGGSADQIARLLAPVLSERLGQPVIVENRPGAGGAVAIGMVAKAPPDGYTLGIGAAGALGVNSVLTTSKSYDPLVDLAPIGNMVSTPFILVAHPEFKPRTVAEIIAQSKGKPGTLSIGHGGPGTMMHLSTELFKQMSKVDAVVVAYKGTAPATLDAMAGQVTLAMSDVPTAISHIKAGQLKAIAVSSKRRSASLPDVPTFAESGLPDYESTGWIAMVAPGGTPAAIIQRLNSELVAALNRPEVKEKLMTTGSDAVPSTPAELGQLMRFEIVKWGNLVKEAQIKVE